MCMQGTGTPPVSVDKGLAPCCALISSQHLEGAGLPCTIDAEEPKALSGAHTQAKAVHGQDTANLPRLVHLAKEPSHSARGGDSCLTWLHPTAGAHSPSHSLLPSPQLRAHLGQVLYLDHVIVSVSTEHSLSLSSHIYVVFHRFSRHRQASRAAKLAGPGQATHPYCGSPASPSTFHSLWLPQEVILTHDGEEESHEALDCHGHQSTCDNVPLERGLHLVKLACGTAGSEPGSLKGSQSLLELRVED